MTPLVNPSRAVQTAPMDDESELSRVRRERGAEGVRALLAETFARCETATAACDALGMRRVERRTRTGVAQTIAPVSALRRAAERAGVAWPFTARGRPPAARALSASDPALPRV